MTAEVRTKEKGKQTTTVKTRFSSAKQQSSTTSLPEQVREYRSNKHPVVQLQRSHGNQAVQHLVRAGAIRTNSRLNGPSDRNEKDADQVVEQMTRVSEPVVQRTCSCGNSTVAGGECEECSKKKRLGLQTKLRVNKPGGIYEQEADRIADQVMTAPARPGVSGALPRTQRYTGQSNEQMDSAPASVDNTLARPGKPLEPGLRRNMEQRFGHDFSHVRVHADADAARSARDIDAHAYTLGTDIVFGAGRYAPSTPSGRHLLAHELAHVIQQSALSTGVGPQSVMRKGFESTVEVCHRVLESRKFEVSNGGVRVVLIANSPDTTVPNCRDFNFGVTLTRSEDWWPDDEIGTCEATTGGIRTFKFANIPAGTYYLTFWRVFDHPYCCLQGDVLVFDEAVTSDGPNCKRDKDLTPMEIVHGALDIAGFIPVLGAIPDGVNAAIYAVEGDWANAGLSAVAMVPAWGDGVKLATIGGKSVIHITSKAAVKLGPDGIAKGLKEVEAASKAAKAAEATKFEKELADQLAKKEAQKLEAEAAQSASKRPTKPEQRPAKEKTSNKPEEKKKKSDRKRKKPKCTPAEIEALNKALHVYCDKPRGCTMQGDTCETATAKVAAGYGCVTGRVTLQQRCFKKGDPGYESHMQQIAQANAALRKCEQIMMEKCT